MIEGLAVILSRVPERLSQYVSSLRSLTLRFLFFSEADSLLGRRPSGHLQLIVIDNADGDRDIIGEISALRRVGAYQSAVIIVIVKEGHIDTGISAMEAGANDYLSAAHVDKELAIRVRMRLNVHAGLDKHAGAGIDLDGIYPLEDRLLIKSALGHIQEHVAFIMSVDDLAIRVGRSARDINKAFNAHFGQTAFAYIRNYRINRAKDLLQSTRIPIGQIAQEVGYSNPANFSTAFKSIVGMSPAQYRARGAAD